MESTAETLQKAIQHHQGGDLATARQLYQSILEREPEHLDALHLLGVAAHQAGENELAVELITKAIRINPNVATIHCNLGAAHQGLGQHDKAEHHFRLAVKLRPDYAEAYSNLGIVLKQQARFEEAINCYQQSIRIKPQRAETHHNLALALKGLSRLDEAIACDRRAMQLRPKYVDAHCSLGTSLLKQGKYDEALKCYETALQLKPNHVESRRNMGVAFQKAGRLSDAIANYQAALELKPNHADTYNHLGSALHEAGDYEAAAQAYRSAIQLRPEFAEAHNNLANSLQSLGQPEDAIATYQRAIALKPDFAEAHNNLGLSLKNRGRNDEAISALQRAIQLKPEIAGAHNDLGVILQQLGRVEEAVQSFQQALAIQPDSAEAHCNLGTSLEMLGQFDQAMRCYRRANELNTNYNDALIQQVHLQQQMCEWENLEENAEAVLSAARSDTRMSPGILMTLPTTKPADQLQCAQRWAADINVRQDSATVSAADKSKLTLGYLSADFRDHAVSNLTLELFESHDREQFEVVAYSFGHDDGSTMRQRLQTAFDRFVDVRPLSFEQAAEQIRSDGVDILIDLMGYTRRARTEILALRPSPIQVNYLGYPGTMGADFVDYILVDKFVVPPDQQPHFSEQLVHLPGCYLVNDSRREIAEPKPSRADSGLPDEGFVFCCFNQSYKVTPQVFSLWMRLLKRVPQSVLWLQGTNRFAKESLHREAERHQVDGDRLIFAEKKPSLADHLARIQCADLFLDTWPYNAHTTASDALWVGCPVVTHSGETFASRVAGSLVHALRLPELCTASPEAYEELAYELATQPDRLAEVREKLATQREPSGVFSGVRFARDVERAYWRMWDQFESGRPPESFAIE